MFSFHLLFAVGTWHDCVMSRIQMRWGTDGLYPYLHVHLDAATVPGSHYGSQSLLFPPHFHTPASRRSTASKHIQEVLLCLCATRAGLWMGNHGDELRPAWVLNRSGWMSATLWSLPSVFLRRSFVLLTTNTSTYLPDVFSFSCNAAFAYCITAFWGCRRMTVLLLCPERCLLDWSSFVEVVCTKGLGKSSYRAISRNIWRSDECLAQTTALWRAVLWKHWPSFSLFQLWLLQQAALLHKITRRAKYNYFPCGVSVSK